MIQSTSTYLRYPFLFPDYLWTTSDFSPRHHGNAGWSLGVFDFRGFSFLLSHHQAFAWSSASVTNRVTKLQRLALPLPFLFSTRMYSSVSMRCTETDHRSNGPMAPFLIIQGSKTPAFFLHLFSFIFFPSLLAFWVCELYLHQTRNTYFLFYEDLHLVPAWNMSRSMDLYQLT